MTPEQETINNTLQVSIGKDISDIKASVTEIKSDIREIKNDFVNRREFNDALEVLREEMAPLRKFIFGLIAVVGLAVVGAILNLVLMKR